MGSLASDTSITIEGKHTSPGWAHDPNFVLTREFTYEENDTYATTTGE